MSGIPADELRAYAHLPIDELVSAISAQRGREITILDSDFADRSGKLCGLWIGLKTRDLIFISDDLSGVHRDHVILHELAHLILDHRVVDVTTQNEVAALFPSLPPSMVSRALLRSHYDNNQEREAEELASTIAAATRGSQRSTWVHNETSRRIADILGQIT